MSVASITFLLFLLGAVILFYLCPVKFRWIVLLLVSLAFYVIVGAWKFLPFMLGTTLIVYLAGAGIGKKNAELAERLAAPGLAPADKKALRAKYKKQTRLILLLALLCSVGVLFVTKFAKYAVFFMNRIANTGWGIAWIIFPLGISYYTFSVVGYLLDVYWKRYDYEKNFFRFLLYSCYFLHIVQGPISRYNLLGQSLKSELRFDRDRIVAGIQLMIWGFFKKLVIADRLAVFVNSAFDGSFRAGSIFLVAAVFDAIMIYTDFSGYVDIVRGASQIFGVELEENFNHPFFSKTVPEFWRRWHMSLGGWFKDYVYYPITVASWSKKLNKWNKKKFGTRFSRIISVFIPCIITWTGLWHGTGKTYLAWGIYYGVLITCSVAFEPQFEAINKKLRINVNSRMWKLFQMIRTFCIFMGGRLLTSPGSLSATKNVIKTMITNFQPWKLLDGSIYKLGINQKNFYLVMVSLILLWGVSMLQQRFGIRDRLGKHSVAIQWIAMYIGIFAVIIFGLYGLGYDAASFVYAQY